MGKARYTWLWNILRNGLWKLQNLKYQLMAKLNIEWMVNLGVQNTTRKNQELRTEVFTPEVFTPIWSWPISILVPIVTRKDRERHEMRSEKYVFRPNAYWELREYNTKATNFNSVRLTATLVLHFWNDYANAVCLAPGYSRALEPTPSCTAILSAISKHARCNITYEFLYSALEGQQQVKDTRRGMHRQ